jgi:long-chain acyl-CoA synthetase
MTQQLLPLELFYRYEKERADKCYMRQPVGREWHNFTWEKVGQEARKMAAAIKKMDLPEKSHIALISKNCAHWIIADLAIWMAGHISIPLYPTLASDTIAHILKHSESKFVFVGKLDDWQGQKDGVPADMLKICFPFWKNEGCTEWDEFIGDTAPMTESPVRPGSDISTIIYTSGTTGLPKGVVHTFESISFPMVEAIKEFELTPADRFLSYLPLSHIAERLLIEIGSLYSGGVVTFVDSLDSFAQTLKETKPTIFLAVPRIWTKFQLGILEKMPAKKLNLFLKIPILKSIVKKKIQAGLGLDEVRYAITGAAPISKDLLLWFDKLGIQILEVYGMTENFGFATFNLPRKMKYGTIGPAWDNGEVKIGENDEIMTRSKATMQGYYKDPEKTAEVLCEDGWLKTGDKGSFDKDGFLRITGRVKDLFKTAKGKYVAPTPIENLFSMCEMIEQVCVVGSGIPQPLGLVVLSEIGKQLDKGNLEMTLKELLQEVNAKVENFERLNNIVVLKDEWSIETGILTPTLKIKRNIVESKYEPNFNDWFNHSDRVIFHH